MEQPKVSIIIPVYNRADIIAETILSALNQTYKNLEIIIVDNCSTDNTYEIIEKFAKDDGRISFYKNSTNVGPVRNWMECLKYISGEYTKILWSDDQISTTFIEKTLRLFDNDTAFVITNTVVYSKNIGDGSVHFFLSTEKITTEEFIEGLILSTLHLSVSPGCAIFRTQDVKDNLLLNIPNNEGLDFSKYGAGNDALIFLLTAAKYKYVKSVNTVESYFKKHPDSFSMVNRLNIYYEWAFLYFVKLQSQKKLCSKFKVILFFRKIKYKNYAKVYASCNTKLDPILIIQLFFNKLFLLFKKHLLFS